MNRAEFIESRRRDAWAAGRNLARDLSRQYCAKYCLSSPPPPAKIIDELLTEFLGCELSRGHLGSRVFAQTEWFGATAVVTVNSDTASIPGVKDVRGVENVAKWHECIHVVEDGPSRRGEQPMLPGLEANLRIVCRRGPQIDLAAGVGEREFWAEEAGRAAAVSYTHLRASTWFQRLLGLAGPTQRSSAWRCLYGAAEDLGVNISALVTQLELEGWIAVQGTGPGSLVHIQATLLESA